MHSVKIEKNLLPSLYFNKLKDIFIGDYFPWYFQPHTLNNRPDSYFMFAHTLFAFEHGQNSNWFKEFEPIIYFLDNKIKTKKLIRMKLNLYTNQNKKINHTAHWDSIDEKGNPRKDVNIAILNFTTCNGGTIINDKKYSSNENEALIFDNLNKHSGIVQTNTPIRIILNIALEKRKTDDME